VSPLCGGGGTGAKASEGAVGPSFGRGRESSKKAHVFHRGAGLKILPPRKYTDRPPGKHHILGRRAHRVDHHRYSGLVHSGATTSIRQPSRDAFASTSSRRLKGGGVSHTAPACGYSHARLKASSALVQKAGNRWLVGVAKARARGLYPGGRPPPGPGRVGLLSPFAPRAWAVVGPGRPPRRRRTGVTPPCRWHGTPTAPGTTNYARNRDLVESRSRSGVVSGRPITASLWRRCHHAWYCLLHPRPAHGSSIRGGAPPVSIRHAPRRA